METRKTQRPAVMGEQMSMGYPLWGDALDPQRTKCLASGCLELAWAS